MSGQPLRIGVVAGEASGDILAAGMIRQIKAQHPDAIVEGIAGPEMLKQGCYSLFDMEELSVMGLFEILPKLRRLLHIRKTVFQHFRDNPPDVFIGVDAPDFNLPLEKKLKPLGIKTVHYVSPTVWAWRENRIFGIGAATDLVLSIFPFEKTVYDKHGFACRYVGHTMADDIPLVPDQLSARKELGFKADDTILAILPGSRGREVESLLPEFLSTAKLLQQKIPSLCVVIPAVNDVRKAQITSIVEAAELSAQVIVTDGGARQAMVASDAVLLSSGTATLEAMLCKRPMVAAYKLGWLTHRVMTYLYKAKYFALPNLLADAPVVPELLQEEVNAENMANLLTPMLTGQAFDAVEKFTEIHQSLKQQADVQSASAVLDLIKSE